MSTRDDRPPFLVSLAGAHGFAAFSALVAFYLWPGNAPQWVVFVDGLPHYPARALRWIGLGSIDDAIAVPCRGLTAALSGHRHVLAFVFLLVLCCAPMALVLCSASGRVTAWCERGVVRSTVLAIGKLALVVTSFAAVSALWSGLFLVRAHDTFVAAERGDTLARDLSLASEPLSADSARRTLGQLFALDDSPLTYHSALEVKLIALAPRLETKITDDPRELLLWSAVIFQIGTALHSLTALAEHGRGGTDEQPWRELTFTGPTGQAIHVRTNFLPPAPIVLLFVDRDRVRTDSWNNFLARVARAFPDDPRCASSYRSLRERGEAYSPDDALIRMSYLAIAHYCIAEQLARAVMPDVPLAAGDPYGALEILLYNSQRSYRRGVDEDLASPAGRYELRDNRISFWDDEVAETRTGARALLDFTAHGLDTGSLDKIDWKNPLNLATALAAGSPGFDNLMPHELSHWVFHALLSEALPGGEALPPCLDEGYAVLLDQLAARAMQQATGDVPLVQRQAADWPRRWLRSTGGSATAAASLALTERSFLEGTIDERRDRYAECFALASIFGGAVIRAAREKGLPMARFAPTFKQTPWATIRADIARGDASVPSPLRELFVP